jgi:potassium efflux system protein
MIALIQRLVAYAFKILLCFSSVLCYGQEVQSEDSLQASFTLSTLMSKMEQQGTQIRKAREDLEDTTDISNYRQATRDLLASVQEKQNESDFFLTSHSREWLIQNLLVKWTTESTQSETLASTLSEVLTQRESELQKIREDIDYWLAAREKAASDRLTGNLRKPITQLLKELQIIEGLLAKRITLYFKFQERVSSSRHTITSRIAELESMLQQDVFMFFKRDTSFLWNEKLLAGSVPIEVQFTRTFAFATKDLKEYVEVHLGRFAIILLFGIGLFISLRATYKHLASQNSSDGVTSSSESLPRIFIQAFTVTLLVALPILTNRPPLLTQLLLLAFSVPLISIVIRPSRGVIRIATIGLLIVYWLYQLTNFFVVEELLNRYIDLFHGVCTMVLLALLGKNLNRFHETYPQVRDFIKHSLIPYLLFFSLAAVILQLVGFTSLSRVLTRGTISFCYLAPVVLSSSVIVRNLFRALETTKAVKQSALAQNYYSSIYTAIKLVAFFLLLLVILKAYSLRPAFNALVEQIWNFGGTFGELTVTVGDIMLFFFTIIVSWFISVMLQVILDGVILSRLNLRRGVAMAVGVIARYSVMVLGFMLAVAATGFDLTKISILAGALGVGIGFGLQNLVADFISGLIIIFERPFVVNDTIESEEIEGCVKEIGIRASKILTHDGAEVIIPNSKLIGNQISNYTLSNNSRRQSIEVQTSAMADPDVVIAMLKNVAHQHKFVLDEPEPIVVFEGQIDESLQFKLYYWVTSETFKTRTDLNVAIFRELKSLDLQPISQIHDVVESSAGEHPHP